MNKERILATAAELYNSQGAYMPLPAGILPQNNKDPGNHRTTLKHTDDIYPYIVVINNWQLNLMLLWKRWAGRKKLICSCFMIIHIVLLNPVYNTGFIEFWPEIGLRIPAIETLPHFNRTQKRSLKVLLFKLLQSGNIFRSDLPQRRVCGKHW